MSRGKVFRRLTLRTHGGNVYLDRWGIGIRSIGTVYLHRMEAPDPGAELHDHPWAFLTVPLWGGYVEERALCRDAPLYAAITEDVESRHGREQTATRRGFEETRRPFRPRVMRLDECHTIIRLRRRVSWSLVIAGPVKRNWGFYLPTGWVDHDRYEDSPQGRSRLMEWDSNYKGNGRSEAAVFATAPSASVDGKPLAPNWPKRAVR